ncbi:MAG: hypothetical protein M3R36_13915 [Bacteroidota bacterium]|nr:hypothetical protein [Bacteroidota bacterium]
MKIVLSLLFLVYISACSGDTETVNTRTKSCFSPKNFSQLIEYIQTRIKFSGIGKFYLKYPPDKTQPDDSIKRP